MAYGKENILEQMEKNLNLASQGIEFVDSKKLQEKPEQPKQSEDFQQKLAEELNNITKDKSKKSSGFDLNTIMNLINNPIVQTIFANQTSTKKDKEEVKKPTLPDFLKKY